MSARRLGALMDAAFEQLTDRETGPTTSPVSEAAVMQAVRDEILRRSAAARRQRGPDPVQPVRAPMPQADLPDAVAGPLAAFLAEIGDTDERVLIPAELAAAMLAALPPLPDRRGPRTRSASRKAAKASGVEASPSTPALDRRCCTAGVVSASTTDWLSRAMIGAGVPPGAITQPQLVATAPG
ncbi:hypothetical protein, partial [Roseomonas sp. SXEYE001]|uniref:hypothetical protein n=1 Tax=Roseomonas xinghualingensis TaxID=2986475 RepID=UPI0021F1273E